MVDFLRLDKDERLGTRHNFPNRGSRYSSQLQLAGKPVGIGGRD